MKKMIYFVLTIMMLNSALAAYDYASVKATLLNQDPDPAEPGKYLELRWKIEKMGNEILNDITYELNLDYPFSFDQAESAIKSLGSWGGNPKSDEYYTLYYKIRVDENAIEDTYKIRLRNTYNNLDNWVTYEYDIRVGEKEEASFVLGTLVSDPTKLTSDTDEAELSIQLENIGDGDAENVKAELILPEGFIPTYTYSNLENMGTIEAGEGENAVFYVDIDENVMGGYHHAQINLTYKEKDDDENLIKNVVLPLNILVKKRPRFEIQKIKYSPEKIYPGNSVMLTIIVKNIGDEKAESVSVRAFKESSQPFDFEEKSDFIGLLEPDGEGQAVLKLEINEEANPKKYIVDLEVRAIQDDDVLVQEESAIIIIDSDVQQEKLLDAQRDKTFLQKYGFYIGICVISIIIGYLLPKKQKK